MATKPKLEFFRFKLNPKKEGNRTFKDFAIDELGGSKSITDEKVTELCFKHFIKSLEQDFAKDEKLKKRLVVIKKKSVNAHLDKQPTFDSANHTIYGVINGGPYGRDRIISDNDDAEDSSTLGRNKAVLLYFYFLLYVPSDHNEGCFIIHSNNSEETITVLFRSFISFVFKGDKYNKAIPDAFCPKSFQDEFKKGAVIRNLTFKSSFIDNIHSTDATQQLFQNYDIKIEVTPKNRDISVTEAPNLKTYLSKKIFGNKDKTKSLDAFEETKITTENDLTKAQKVFEWNHIDHDFVPVVYLENRLSKKNADGTPDFEELGKYCLTLFDDEILNEIRPDLHAVKIK